MRCQTGYLTALSFGAALALGMAGPAESQPVYDGFSVTFPSLYSGSGSGFSGNWQGSGSGILRESSLAYPGLLTSGGSLSAPTDYSSFYRVLMQSVGADNTTVYLSFLLQPADNVPNFWCGLLLGGLFIGKPGGGTPDQYVIETSGGSGQVSSGVPVVPGEAALLVVKAQFLPGGDVYTLYVNPAPGDPEPASGVVKSDLKVGVVSTISTYAYGVAFGLDEIRIGATYADVVPVAPPGTATKASLRLGVSGRRVASHLEPTPILRSSRLCLGRDAVRPNLPIDNNSCVKKMAAKEVFRRINPWPEI